MFPIELELFSKPVAFQQIHNSVSRHVRTFLDVNEASENYKEFFEYFVENDDIFSMFKWIFDLSVEKPKVVEKFTKNPFSNDHSISVENYDGYNNERQMTVSYITKLRIFYQWIFKEISGLLRYSSKIISELCKISIYKRVKRFCLNSLGIFY